MEAIAAEAGVSKLTLYSHFKDKEALFCAAVKTTCETRLPRRLFQIEEGCDIEDVLLAIGGAFNQLVNSPESIGLHRVMVTMATQNPGLVKMFFDAGPQQLLFDLQQLFTTTNTLGLLKIDDPLRAAEHFCSLIKGTQHFRLLVGYAEAPAEEESNLHVRDVVTVFLRAYRG